MSEVMIRDSTFYATVYYYICCFTPLACFKESVVEYLSMDDVFAPYVKEEHRFRCFTKEEAVEKLEAILKESPDLLVGHFFKLEEHNITDISLSVAKGNGNPGNIMVTFPEEKEE